MNDACFSKARMPGVYLFETRMVGVWKYGMSTNLPRRLQTYCGPSRPAGQPWVSLAADPCAAEALLGTALTLSGMFSRYDGKEWLQQTEAFDATKLEALIARIGTWQSLYDAIICAVPLPTQPPAAMRARQVAAGDAWRTDVDADGQGLVASMRAILAAHDRAIQVLPVTHGAYPDRSP